MPDNPPKDFKLPDATINESLQIITTNENNVNSKYPIHEPTKEEILVHLFIQQSDFTPATLD